MVKSLSSEELNQYMQNLDRLRRKYDEKIHLLSRRLSIYNGYGVERELEYNRKLLAHAINMKDTLDYAYSLLEEQKGSGDAV